MGNASKRPMRPPDFLIGMEISGRGMPILDILVFGKAKNLAMFLKTCQGQRKIIEQLRKLKRYSNSL